MLFRTFDFGHEQMGHRQMVLDCPPCSLVGTFLLVSPRFVGQSMWSGEEGQV